MPKEGIEPSHPYGLASLSRTRLPVPPLRLANHSIINSLFKVKHRGA